MFALILIVLALVLAFACVSWFTLGLPAVKRHQAQTALVQGRSLHRGRHVKTARLVRAH